MYLLNNNKQALHLIDPSCNSLQLKTVLQANNPGIVYADSKEPQTAVVYHQGEGGFFFIGKPSKSFFETILDNLDRIEADLRVKLSDFEFSFDSRKWQDKLELGGFQTCQQYIYHSKEDTQLDDLCIEGIYIIPITKEVCSYENSEFLTKPILKWWFSLEDYFSHKIGFAAVHKGKVIGRCLLDGITGNQMGIGIAVEADYRKRNIATALAYNMVNEINKRGYQSYWECTDNNYGSQALANKCELIRIEAYDLFWKV